MICDFMPLKEAGFRERSFALLHIPPSYFAHALYDASHDQLVTPSGVTFAISQETSTTLGQLEARGMTLTMVNSALKEAA